MSDDLDKLAALIKREREALLLRWRQLVRELPSARGLDVATLNDHIPILIDELGDALRAKSEQTITEAISDDSAPAHGLQRLHDGFDIQEVVAEYNVLRGCIHDLADSNGLTLQGKAFHTINRVFDHAIGLAVQTYATQRELDMRRRREEYLAFVAHDLRTPLSVIAWAGKDLEEKIPDLASKVGMAQVLRAMRRSVQQLEGLVRKVLEENTNLEHELGTTLERREFDLWPFAESLVRDLQPVAVGAGTALVNRVPGDLVVYADAGLLRRVFQNLLANAIKYSPGGEVIIGAREIDGEGVVESWVGDNGAGIRAEFLAKVFEKGETDAANEGGMGLGLAIVKTFVEAHGGKVVAESKEGVGSTFRILLPTKGAASPRENR